MSYQVLARKWRPRRFSELVGQEHVVQALSNALDHDRLHHAYLFTGTRGVGKTTLARIFAKSVNCERGVSSSPCGECTSCREVDEGRFVDLLEVDAASRTKVDQTRELLENVPYAPVRGRYKVYLIDEVHMFSDSSFNALLKTLEEPPPHVKFLLATTDPQKVPMTVLSRCLQFSLRRLDLDQIRGQLARILDSEGVEYEAPALDLLARGADGSMRDGLSLLDQAIAYGGGIVADAEVRAMLGAVSRDTVLQLITALADQDAPAMLRTVADLSQASRDFASVLAEILRLLHRLAVLQMAPDAPVEEAADREAMALLAMRLSPEDVQLFYEIGTQGQRTLAYAPDSRSGLEMILLRMLAFRPSGPGVEEAPPEPAKGLHEPQPRSVTAKPRASERGAAPASPPTQERPPEAKGAPDTVAAQLADWADLVGGLKLGGLASQLAAHSVLGAWDKGELTLLLDPANKSLRTDMAVERLHKALAQRLGLPLKLRIEIAEAPADTPAQQQARRDAEIRREAAEGLSSDPLVRAVGEKLGGRLDPDSIVPRGG